MSDIVKFPGREPAVERYDDDDDLRHAEHFRCLHTRIDDCAIMSSFAMEELEKWTKKSIIIQADPTLHWEQYDIY